MLACAATAPAATTGKPTLQRTPYEDHQTSEACGFPVQLDATGTALDISYTDPLGNDHLFEAGPQVKQTMTNLDTGKSIVVNISGPGQYTFGADGSFTLVGTGNWSWTRVDPATLAPGIFLTQGRFVLSISASGVRTITSTGTTIDLCAQLA